MSACALITCLQINRNSLFKSKHINTNYFFFFSCGLIFAPSTSLPPPLLLYTFHVVLFVSTHTDTHSHSFDGRNHRPQKFESLLQSMSYYRSVSKFYDHQKSIKYFVACVKLYLNDEWCINVLFNMENIIGKPPVNNFIIYV